MSRGRDAVARLADLDHRLTAMETRANPYWDDSLLGYTDPAWIAFGLASGWSSSTGRAYRIVADMVYLRHNVSRSTGANPFATLPTRATPAFDHEHIVWGGAESVRLRLKVDHDGDLHLLNMDGTVVTAGLLAYLVGVHWPIRDKMDAYLGA